MEISAEGFKTTTGMDGSIRLLFDSSKPKECCEFAIKAGIKKISLYPGVYTACDLEPLLALKDFIEELFLDDKVDYSNIHLFSKLLGLSVPDNKKSTVDLSAFLNLESLNCSFSKRLQGLETCTKLKRLTIGNYKSKNNDLETMPILSRLEYLSLIKTDIITLQGINRFSSLKKIEIYNASKLEYIAQLQTLSNSLSEIQIEKCKVIKDYETLGHLKLLKKITLLDSGQIKSLSFIKNLPALEFINFWGSNIIDGDIGYCENIGFVGFDNKKHYTHKTIGSGHISKK